MHFVSELMSYKYVTNCQLTMYYIPLQTVTKIIRTGFSFNKVHIAKGVHKVIIKHSQLGSFVKR